MRKGCVSKMMIGMAEKILLRFRSDKTAIKRNTNSFSEKLYLLKDYCQKNNIRTKDICVVGSSLLELKGIRHAHDIDVCVSKQLAKKFSTGAQKLLCDDDSLEKVGRGWFKDAHGNVLVSDDQIIYDSDCHFTYQDVKFVNLEFVYYKKKIAMRDKDVRDLALMEEYARKNNIDFFNNMQKIIPDFTGVFE